MNATRLHSLLAAAALAAGSVATASESHSPDFERSVEGHASDRFHFTTIRSWIYSEVLPNSSDTSKLGLEFNSAWGWGDFNVTNISYFEFADYPRSVPGLPAGTTDTFAGSATGITDLLTAFLFSKKSVHHGRHHFSYGFAAQLPTASDKTLGTGKWSLGPAIEYEYHHGRFYAAFVALQLWDVTGDSDRHSVNYLMIKPMITYDLNDCWKLVYMPYGISIYWNKLPGNDVYLPLGGGLQYNFDLWGNDVAVSAQAFQYAIRPSKGAKYDLRLMLEANF